jgi:putative acetyltransferase
MTIDIRPFEPNDAAQVEALFITVNRTLAPPDMKDRFETYITASITEEIGRIEAYYTTRNGRFWVAYETNTLVGMVGVEKQPDGAMELRRMYVSSDFRRKGIAHKMLEYVENQCRMDGIPMMVLSTSELQPAAIGFYEASGYELVKETTAQTASNKTIGGGIRRRYYSKNL